jgi:hypothetical protein
MSLDAALARWIRTKVIITYWIHYHWDDPCCGAKILASLIQMAFDCGDLFRKMLADQFLNETWPSGKVTSFDSFYPSVRDWAESCGM